MEPTGTPNDEKEKHMEKVMGISVLLLIMAFGCFGLMGILWMLVLSVPLGVFFALFGTALGWFD